MRHHANSYSDSKPSIIMYLGTHLIVAFVKRDAAFLCNYVVFLSRENDSSIKKLQIVITVQV